MKILIAVDSFKGSLSTGQAAECIGNGIRRVFPKAEIEAVPIADGGEGTVETLLTSVGGRKKYVTVTKPNGGFREAAFGILKNKAAILEMAEASGLPLVEPDKRNIMKATTYGTGELIKAALDEGCSRILIGIGGSATNDGGIGMAQALGVSFKNSRGEEVGAGGGVLTDIVSVDLSGLDRRISDTEITVMCDVTNPLYGACGAARIFGPQKGASKEEVSLLDEGLKHLAEIMRQISGEDLSQSAGAGAAGGLGWGLQVFLGAKLQPGIEAIMDAAGMDEKIKAADLVITGEGRIDSQSVCGKVIDGVAGRAKRYHKPVAAIAGSLAGGLSEVYGAGIGAMEASVCRPMQLTDAMAEAPQLAADAAERLMRAVRLGMCLSDEKAGKN